MQTVIEEELRGEVPVPVLQAFPSKVTIFTGYYGSGKTEVALHVATALVAAGRKTSLVDLDFLKPVFRSRESRVDLNKLGVKLVAPGGELAAADLPVVLPCIGPLLQGHRGDEHVLVDLAGDAGGAKAIAQFSTALKKREHDLLMVVNTLRPFASSVDRIVKAVRELEDVTRMRITGLVANTNLGAHSTADMVLRGLDITREAARQLEIPVRALTLPAFLREALEPHPAPEPRLWLHRRVLLPWEEQAL